jgi:hypothetical protein
MRGGAKEQQRDRHRQARRIAAPGPLQEVRAPGCQERERDRGPQQHGFEQQQMLAVDAREGTLAQAHGDAPGTEIGIEVRVLGPAIAGGSVIHLRMRASKGLFSWQGSGPRGAEEFVIIYVIGL